MNPSDPVNPDVPTAAASAGSAAPRRKPVSLPAFRSLRAYRSLRAFRSLPAFRSLAACVLLVVVIGPSAVGLAIAAEETQITADDPLIARVTTPMLMLIEGRPFRLAAEEIARRGGVNLWIDRGVDPTATVDVGRVGPTLYDALAAVAHSQDCVIFPLRGVVLIGRPQRVDAVASELLDPDRVPRQIASAEVGWDDLTTPAEALAIALGGLPRLADNDDPLPHDLWPAVRWTSVERSVATALVRGQFEPAHESRHPLSFTRGYAWPRRGPESAPEHQRSRWQASVTPADPAARVRVIAPRGSSPVALEVRGNAAAHRVAIALLSEQVSAARGESPPRDDRRTFSLKIENKPAAAVIRELAAADGRQCQIDAPLRGDALVSLEAQDQTLRQLAEMVAQLAGLELRWGQPVRVADL